MKHRSKVLIYLIAGCLLTWLSSVHATITCVSPGSGTFKAGDPLTLGWTSDSSSPKVSDIVSMTATLYCDSGLQIASLPITNFNGPVTWVVPSVGNATTAGGTTGTCLANSFHVEYSGVYTTLLGIIKTAFDHVRCGTITITPAPNNTITTTSMAPTTAAPTSTVVATSASTTTRATTSAASPTTTFAASPDENKPKTYIIVIVAIVAFLILFLVVFGTWWYLRMQKLRRMQDAILPWSAQSNNQFAKVSSMDEGARSPSVNGRSTGVAAAAVGGAAALGSNKSQPMIPQQTTGYYPDEGYGYGKQGAGGGYNRQQGYNNEDEYYNPYYAQGGPSPPGPNAAYYGGNRAPYQTPHDPFQGQQQSGYFPPPPPVTTGPQGMGLPSSATPDSSMTSLPNTLTSSTLTSSTRRAPQVILPEMGHREADDIPMKDMTASS